jgi:hypothetical protein
MLCFFAAALLLGYRKWHVLLPNLFGTIQSEHSQEWAEMFEFTQGDSLFQNRPMMHALINIHICRQESIYCQQLAH